MGFIQHVFTLAGVTVRTWIYLAESVELSIVENPKNSDNFDIVDRKATLNAQHWMEVVPSW